jgi:tryptophanyl-tRNA synthetase
LKAAYRRGGVADSAVKARLEGVLEDVLAPIRERRAELAGGRDSVIDIIEEGSRRSRELAAPIAAAVRDAFGLGGLRRGREAARLPDRSG